MDESAEASTSSLTSGGLAALKLAAGGRLEVIGAALLASQQLTGCIDSGSPASAPAKSESLPVAAPQISQALG